jgi:hypothetical protein
MYMIMCPCHGLTYVDHGEVALPSVLVDPVEAAVVLPELPQRPPSLLLFLPPLRQLFLFWLLLLLGGRDGTKGCGLGAGGAVLVSRAVGAADGSAVSRWISSRRRSS